MKDNNILIAEFMGWEKWSSRVYDSNMKLQDYKLIGYHSPKELGYWYYDSLETDYGEDNLRFHESWDWLMPVVNRIRTIVDENHNKDSRAIYFLDWSILELSNEFGDLYETVVDFIKWYNENNIN